MRAGAVLVEVGELRRAIGVAELKHLVDVVHALHLELSQPWYIQLPTAIWA